MQQPSIRAGPVEHWRRMTFTMQQVAGRPPAESQQWLRTFLARFRDHSAALNQTAFRFLPFVEHALCFDVGDERP